MQQAIDLAKLTAKEGDVPVGAIVVNDNSEIISRGINLKEANSDPTAHAEIVAIRNAAISIQSHQLRELTLIVTLEPCAMCAGAILQARLKRLIFGAYNKKFGSVGSVYDLIRDPRSDSKTEVYSGICENLCIEELNNFFKKIRVQ
jgi:tRNA(adenine34) deaminase